jgi:cytochrome bd-type quinol oxidase subunit 2
MRTIAVCQKGIIVCFLIQFTVVVVVIAVVFVARHEPPSNRLAVDVTRALSLVLLATMLVAMGLTLLLLSKVFRSAAAGILALLTLVPLIGLLALLVVNSRATFVLRQNGHKVGLFGARLSEFKGSSPFDPASPHPNPLPEGEGGRQLPERS